MDGCKDGTFPATGQKFFSCLYGRGLYYPLYNLQPDQRYAPEVATDGNREKHPVISIDVPLVFYSLERC